MNGQPPTNPDGPLYTNQGIRLDTPAQTADDDLIRTASDAIALATDTFWPTNYDGENLIDAETGPDSPVGKKLTAAIRGKNWLEAWRLIHHFEPFYYMYTGYRDGEVYRYIKQQAEKQLGSMTADQKRDYGVTPLATTLNDLLPPQGESTMKIDDVVNEETYDGDDFHEAYGELWYNEDEEVDEAEYQGRKVKLGKPMRGDVKKFKVYVKNPKGNVVKVNFGDPNMKIKKSNPKRRKSFRARHNCDNPGPRHKARYWSCRKW
jgi:hypothetical protein